MQLVTIKKWQPSPATTLVSGIPVQEGQKLESRICVVCSAKMVPHTYYDKMIPLVLRCESCGHKSWAHDS